MSTSPTAPAITKLVEAITSTTADGRWIDTSTGKPGAGSDSSEAAPGRALGRQRFAFVRAAVEGFASALSAPGCPPAEPATEQTAGTSGKPWHAAVAREVADDEVRTHAPRNTVDPRGRLLSLVARGGADTEEGFRKVFGAEYGLGWPEDRIQLALTRVWEASVAPIVVAEPAPSPTVPEVAPTVDEVAAGTTVADVTRALRRGESVSRMFGGITKVHVKPGRDLGWALGRTSAGGTMWRTTLSVEDAAWNYVAWCADAARWCAEAAEWEHDVSAKVEAPTAASEEPIGVLIDRVRDTAGACLVHLRADLRNGTGDAVTRQRVHVIGVFLDAMHTSDEVRVEPRAAATPTAVPARAPRVDVLPGPAGTWVLDSEALRKERATSARLRSALSQARDWIRDDVDPARCAETGAGRQLADAIDAMLLHDAPAPEEVAQLREQMQRTLQVVKNLDEALVRERAEHAKILAGLDVTPVIHWARRRLSAEQAAAGETPQAFALRLLDSYAALPHWGAAVSAAIDLTHRWRMTHISGLCLDCDIDGDSFDHRVCSAASGEARDGMLAKLSAVEAHRDEIDADLALLRDGVVNLLSHLDPCWRCKEPATKSYVPDDDLTCDRCDTGSKGTEKESDLPYAEALRNLQVMLADAISTTEAAR